MLQHTLSRIAALAIFLGSTAAWAGSVTIPNSFVGGTPAVAGDVNANFTAVKSAVDGNQNGAAQTAYNNLLVTTNTSQIAVQDSITIPAPGVVVVIATGYVFHAHVNTVLDNTIITLDNASGTNPLNSIGTTEVRTPAQVPTGSFWAVPYAITRTFVEATPGAKTYYVNCRKSSGGTGHCYGNHLTLLYFATSH